MPTHTHVHTLWFPTIYGFDYTPADCSSEIKMTELRLKQSNLEGTLHTCGVLQVIWLLHCGLLVGEKKQLKSRFFADE